jgi:CheY-like chemotaxis protein
MATQSALDLADALAQQKNASPTGELRAQAAFVRALVDEVERYHPADKLVVALRDQLGEELTRLAQLIEEGTGEAPAFDQTVDVLIVDDDDDALRTHQKVLAHLGYPSRTAGNGEDALRAYQDQPAAIVLSDWRMPGMSGLDLCTALKKHDAQAYVILVTAYDEAERLVEGVRGGADDFLRKPVDLDELEGRLLAGKRLVNAVRRVAALQSRLSSNPPKG